MPKSREKRFIEASARVLHKGASHVGKVVQAMSGVDSLLGLDDESDNDSSDSFSELRSLERTLKGSLYDESDDDEENERPPTQRLLPSPGPNTTTRPTPKKR